MEIDWDKYPEATHYDNRPGCAPAFMRKNHNGRDWEYVGMNGNWIMYGPIDDRQLSGLVKRPDGWSPLPPVESVVRIVPGSTVIWDVAEQFVGVDCRLKAVFMLEETRMVAVENIGSGQCCCFWASMVRTPEQAKAEERMNRAIALYTAVMNHPCSSPWHRVDSERQEHFLSLVDAGWQRVKP